MRLPFAVVSSVFFIATAAAAPLWSVPGWYQVEDSVAGPILWKGPFASEDDCKLSLPESDEDVDYSCEYLATRPDWDD